LTKFLRYSDIQHHALKAYISVNGSEQNPGLTDYIHVPLWSSTPCCH